MKKAIVWMMILLLILAAGCSDGNTEGGPLDGPRPVGETTAATKPASTEPETTAGTEAPETTAAPVTVVTEAPTETDAQASTEASTEPSTEAPTETDPEELDPWKLMEEGLFEQGSYKDRDGNDYSFSYSLPRLNADTADARAINAEIDSVFGAQVRAAKEAMQNGHGLAFYSCGYYGEVWGDVLTLVVIGHWDFSFDDYGVYCYDAAAGRRLDTPAVLEKMGVSQESFLETCKERFRQRYTENYSTIPENEREAYGYYEALERSDSPEFVNLNLMAYPNANGDIVVIAPLVSLVGADYYYSPIILGIN